ARSEARAVRSSMPWYRRPAVRAAAITILALRLGTGLYIVLLQALAAQKYHSAQRLPDLPRDGAHIFVVGTTLTGLPGVLTSPWVRWDGDHFLNIAIHGYGRSGSAFLPLYPLLIRVTGTLLGGHLVVGALLVSTIAAFFMFLLLYRLAQRLTGSE